MPNQFASIPPFWQSVLGSLLAAIIVGLAVQLYRIQAAQWRRDRTKNKKYISALKGKLASNDPLVRIDGYFTALFTLMVYLFLGNLFWILASVVSPFLQDFWAIAALLYALSLVMFAAGLLWLKETTTNNP